MIAFVDENSPRFSTQRTSAFIVVVFHVFFQLLDSHVFVLPSVIVSHCLPSFLIISNVTFILPARQAVTNAPSRFTSHPCASRNARSASRWVCLRSTGVLGGRLRLFFTALVSRFSTTRYVFGHHAKHRCWRVQSLFFYHRSAICFLVSLERKHSRNIQTGPTSYHSSTHPSLRRLLL